jgi:hypothetical protein
MQISSKASHVPARFLYPVLAALGAWMLLPAGSAQAAVVTVGSPLKTTFGGDLCSGPSGTLANSALSEAGANVTSPVSGAVVGWKMNGNYSGGPFRLRVLKPAGSGQYTGAGSSATVSPISGPQAYTTDLPIAAGDLIGLDVHEGCIGAAGVAGSDLINWNPALPDGSTLAPPYPFSNIELGFNAEVQPAPTISGLDVTKGSIEGGTSVTIAGSDFAGVSAVKFGSAPASSFTVNSETGITAVAPPATVPGAVDVTVTTAAGTTAVSAADKFTYTACVVPKLKGKRLKAAKRKLKEADCKLGKVKGQKTKFAKVKKQSPKFGKVLAPGSKVSLKLGG